ncbi:MAG TPA: tetratricopeptide repeat protein [Actinophytocola sp.]|jgi:hypothetical protein|nr:tetratricopeptide repeat protein [Actinophytocola sp.]
MDRRELGQYREVLEGHEEVAKLIGSLVGDAAPGTLLRRSYLAVARRRAGDHATALNLSGPTYARLQQVYGPTHPSTLACAVAYATDLRDSGRLDESHTVGETARRGYRHVFSDEHPMALAADANAAITMRMRGDAEGARELNERAIDLFVESLGSDHPLAVACSVNLASDLARSGDLEGAVRIGAKAYDRAKRNSRAFGPAHPTTLLAHLNLAFDQRAQGADDDEYREVVDRLSEVLGAEHPVVQGAQRGTRANCDIDPLPL